LWWASNLAGISSCRSSRLAFISLAFLGIHLFYGSHQTFHHLFQFFRLMIQPTTAVFNPITQLILFHF
jgi:hypothetical protein